MSLDSGLLDAMRAGKVVLFLGAGASRGAKNHTGAEIPDANQLAKKISQKFLDPEYADLDFKTAYDFACSHTSVREVQNFISKELGQYNPAQFHYSIPTFVWAGLATTNYDLIIERAYEACAEPAQELVCFKSDSDKVADTLSPGEALYVKLHGCITQYQKVDPPLIASTEQVIEHRDGRAGQFAQFMEWATTKVIVFAGYAIGDANLRTLINELKKEGDKRPRHYLVRPGIKQVEQQYWDERRIHPISMTFAEFIQTLEAEFPPKIRRLALAAKSETVSTFTRFISVAGASESASLRAYLTSKCEHVSRETSANSADPRRFYNGFDLGWYPVQANLDVTRRVTQSVLTEQIVAVQSLSAPRLIVLKAHAGAGKTVVLRRLAWEAARTFEKLAFFIDRSGQIDPNRFDEIFSLTNKPVFLFLDDAADFSDTLYALMQRAAAKKWPLVVICAERFNEWNVYCDQIDELVDFDYEIGYLSPSEINDLLGKLEAHGALGFLATVPRQERPEHLRETLGRQLLVALHEATKNRNFEDIVADEYRQIVPPEARLLYLDICALHRFGPPVRAGLIARVHGISFDEFKKRFFEPLEAVVELKWDNRTNDWVYRARHSFIAHMIYTTVLKTVEEKFENVMRIVSKLNPSYSYDREVLYQLVRGNTLAETFRDREKGSAVYDAAISATGHEAGILQQRGIYEMRLAADQATLDRAESYLQQALDLEPYNKSVKHSLSELALTRSRMSSSEYERESWRQRASAQASALASSAHSSHAQHTVVKAAIDAVKDALEKNEQSDNDLTEEAASQAIKHAEDVLRTGLQRFPNDTHLLAEEAALGQLLQNADRALRALEKANKANPRSELIARRLARILRSKKKFEDAVQVLRKAVEFSPGNHALNFDLAMRLRDLAPDSDVTNCDTILYHLGRSFSAGDKNYEAQFWYARQLCLAGRGEDAKKVFERLKKAPIPYARKIIERGIVLGPDGLPALFYGQIYVREPSYGFIRADKDGLEVFFRVLAASTNNGDLALNRRVTYNLGFTFHGPIVMNLQPLLI